MLEVVKRKFKDIRKSFEYLSLTSEERNLKDVAQKVTDRHLSYLSMNALYDLAQVVAANEKLNLPGVIIETGCALGGSSIAIASTKNKERKFFVYDVFGMIPAPSQTDDNDVHERYQVIQSKQSPGLGGGEYYGYIENLYDKVVENFASFKIDIDENNVYLIKGLYDKTLNIECPVALAHIDCDWFESVFLSLQRIEPHLVSGGTLVIDDYYMYSGCTKAVDEYFSDKRSRFEFLNKSRLHIIKK